MKANRQLSVDNCQNLLSVFSVSGTVLYMYNMSRLMFKPLIKKMLF